MGVINKTQLINASLDADDLAVVVNGDENTVANTRTGGPIKSVKNLFKGILSSPPAAWMTLILNSGLSYNNKGDPGGNAMAVGLFSEIAALSIPNGTDLIQTSGHGAKGLGVARYLVGGSSDDPAEETAYSTNTSNGRPVYLAEANVDVQMFGVIGDGNASDLGPLIAALQYANAKQYDGFAAHIKHPGCRLTGHGLKINLEGITEELAVECDLDLTSSALIVPEDYNGDVVRLGLVTSGQLLATATIAIGDVLRGGSGEVVTGSCGIAFANLNAANIRIAGRVDGFERPHRCKAIGQGTVYCTIQLGQASSGKIYLDLEPDSTGWCNSNTWLSSNFYMGGFRIAGNRIIRLDGTMAGNELFGNKFIGFGLEGPGAEYAIEAKNAINNLFFADYFETGLTPIDVIVAGPTLTDNDHGLNNGEMLTFIAVAMPTGMFIGTPYYVVNATTNTFQLSLSKGGSPITFGSSGTTVKYYTHIRCLWDGDGANTYNNVILYHCSPLATFIDHIQTGQAYNNGEDSIRLRFAEPYSPADLPPYRGRNKYDSDSISRAIYAAYAPTVDPQTQADLWAACISDRGFMCQNTDGSIAGRIWFANGIFNYEPSASGTTRQIASSVRSYAGPITVPTAIVPANDELDIVISTTTSPNNMPGIAEGDHPTLTPTTNLPADTAILGQRVSAANEITIRVRNFSGVDVAYTGVQFTAIVENQYY